MAIAYASAVNNSAAISAPLVVDLAPSTVNGDLLLMAAVNALGQDLSAPAGWVQINEPRVGSFVGVDVWAKIANNEPANVTLTPTLSVPTLGCMVRYTGVPGPNPVRANAAVTGGPGTVSPVPASLSGLVAGDMGIVVYGWGGDNPSDIVTFSSPPAGWTQRISNGTAGSGTYNSGIRVYERLNATTPATLSSDKVGYWGVSSVGLASTTNAFPSTADQSGFFF